MKIAFRKFRRTAAVAAVGLAAALGAVVASPSAAVAASMHLYGTACPGGYIVQLIAVTSTESVYGTFAGNEWDVHLNYYTGNQDVNFAVKCNNNVWYYPIRNIQGYASPRWVGAI